MEYPDLAILPHQNVASIMHCATCGNLLYDVSVKEESRDYYFCRKCKVVKWYAQYS